MSDREHDSKVEFYDSYVQKAQGDTREWRIRKVLSCIPKTTASLLDVGCGPGTFLEIARHLLPNAHLVGVDVASSTPQRLAGLGLEGHAIVDGARLPFGDESFEVIFAGEVIEHMVHTDLFIKEARRVLAPRGTLVITTPNLAYLPNRFLLALGIQPLFTEVSLEANLGRRFKAFGQGNPTQGHLRIFTAHALRDLLRLHGFGSVTMSGYPMFQTGVLSAIDRSLALRYEWAAGVVAVALRE